MEAILFDEIYWYELSSLRSQKDVLILKDFWSFLQKSIHYILYEVGNHISPDLFD